MSGFSSHGFIEVTWFYQDGMVMSNDMVISNDMVTLNWYVIWNWIGYLNTLLYKMYMITWICLCLNDMFLSNLLLI